MLAVAVESVVKLAAFLAVGVVATFFLFGSPAGFIDAVTASPKVQAALEYRTSLGTWVVATVLSGFAILMLPRQFYVTVVENRSESELKTATWVFPVYLVAINLFVIPLAFAGAAMRRRPHQRRSLRAVAAAAQRPRRPRHGRLHRRPVGCDRHGHRRNRGAVDHDLQRSGDPAVHATALEARASAETRTGRTSSSTSAACRSSRSCSWPSSTTARAPTMPVWPRSG